MDYLVLDITRSQWPSRGISLEHGDKVMAQLASRARRLVRLSTMSPVDSVGGGNRPGGAFAVGSAVGAADSTYLFEFSDPLDLTGLAQQCELTLCPAVRAHALPSSTSS